MMTKRKILVVGVVFQFMALAVIWWDGVYPFLFGREILLETGPRDPRDYFMGQYVDLFYPGISSVSLKGEGDREFPAAAWIYVPLAQEGELWRGAGASLEPPREGLYLRGYGRRRGEGIYSVSYGIERLYASPERARRFENPPGRGAPPRRVRVMVASNGRTGLVEIVEGAQTGGAPPTDP